MAKRRNKKELSAVVMVKQMARHRLGSPPGEQTIPNRKKQKREKYKPSLQKLLQNE
jgi:hypothetical protein